MSGSVSRRVFRSRGRVPTIAPWPDGAAERRLFSPRVSVSSRDAVAAPPPNEASTRAALTIGGGGVLDVESHEELDAIMSRFPFAPFSTIEIIPLSDIDESLAHAKAFVGEMLAGMASR